MMAAADRACRMAAVISLLAAAALAAAPPGADEATPRPDLVDVAGLIPDAVLDLPYARSDNFLGRAVYPEARCLLLRPAAERLARAAARLRRLGYRLLLWDCYRPLSVQRELWRAKPRAGYVADPRRGGSHHNRGVAVDLSLAAANGRPVEMPTTFDTFDERAHADAVEGISAAALRHRRLLRQALEAEGFLVNPREWWHFAARDARSHPLLDVPLSEAGR
jgi:D-alanyl-D-alanine dipeptidase